MGTKFLDYEYSVRVRGGQGTTTDQMIQDIYRFRETFEKNKSTHVTSKKMKELELKYFVEIQRERGIGKERLAEIRQVIDKVENEKDSKAGSTSSKKMIDIKQRDGMIILEAENVYRAYKMIKEQSQKNPLVRILDSTHIVDIHILLMNKIPEYDGSVPGYTPGEFSTKPRGFDLDDGKFLPYYKFERTTDVKKAVDDLLLHYSGAIKEIQEMENTKEKIKAVFKCAAKVLFGLGLIHPFIDGNGRMSRLVCYHCLSLISPFPTPVYNVYSNSTRDEFGNSLMEARGGGNAGEETLENLKAKVRESKPSRLCAILIEANWSMWKQLLSDLSMPL